MDIDSIAQALKADQAGNGYIACCPAHDDKKPSLSLSEAEGKVLVKCHAGCSQEQVISALRDRGLWPNINIESAKILSESVPLKRDRNSAAAKYVENRIDHQVDFPSGLYSHGRLAYYDKGRITGYFPALIVPFYNSSNLLTGILRIFLTPDGKKAAVPTVKKALGSFKGSQACIAGNSHAESIGLTEGVEDAIAVHLATGLPVLVAGGSTNLKNVIPPLYVKNVKIFADKDPHGAGQKHAFEAQKVLTNKGLSVEVFLPQCEGKGKRDALDEYREKGPHALSEAKPVPIQEIQQSSEPKWLPLPLPSVVAVPEDIPEDMIPPPIREWVTDETARIGTRRASFVAVVIAAVAIVVGKKVTICPKALDTGWKVALSVLWVALIGRSGSKKTPTISPALMPLHQLEKKAREKYEDEQRKNEPQISALEAAIEGLKRRISEASRNYHMQERQLAEEKLAETIARLKELKTVERRFTVQDATVEKLGMLLVENPNGLGVVFDEMIGWVKGLERKGHETARSFYLKAHNGLHDERVDRVTREAVYIPHLFAVIIGGIQPDGFNQYIQEAITGEGSGADGLIQRFQLALFHTVEGLPQGEDRTPNEAAKGTANEIFSRLDQLTASQLGLPEGKPPHMHFGQDAQILFNQWHEKLQTRLLDDELPHVVESHISKQRATMPALALAFELLNWASQTPEGPVWGTDNIVSFATRTVSLESVRLAARWIEYLTNHMKCLYSPSLNSDVVAAHAIRKKILQKKLKDGFSLRELCRHNWKGLSSQEIVEKGIQILEERNHIRLIPNETSRNGRPPSPRYEINPATFKEGL